MRPPPSACTPASARNALTGYIIRYSLFLMRIAVPNRSVRPASPRGLAASGGLAATLVLVLLAPAASGQAPAPTEQALVPTSYANVHAGPSSNAAPLVLVPRGTVLPVVGRRGEWVQVRLSPELRQTGMVMRWYVGRHEFVNDGQRLTIGDEDSGWMHDSTVEITEAQVP